MSDLSQLSDDQLLELYRRARQQQGGTRQPAAVLSDEPSEIPRNAGGRPAPSRASPLLDSPVGGFLRGLRDPIDAGAQMLTHVLPDGVVGAVDALGNKLAAWGLPVERTQHVRDPATGQQGNTVDAVNQRAEQDYRQNWRRGDDPGIDTGRIVGNIVGTVPAARMFPMGAATLPGRIAQGGAMGAALGTLQPVDMSDPETSFATQKAIQAGLGGAFGSAFVPVGEAVAKGVGAVARKGGQVVDGLSARAQPTTFNATVNVQVDNALQTAGFDVASVPTQIRESLRRDVTTAMRMGGAIDPDVLARMADARMVGVNLTRGQATRDPKLFGFEQNTRDITGAGEPLQQRFAQQNTQLIDAINQTGPGRSQYDAGQALISGLRAHDEAASRGVTAAYTAARETAGTGAEIPMQRLAQRAGEVLETYGTENVPGVVMRRLQSYGLFGGEQTKSFTVGEADKLRKLLTANLDPTKKAEAAALSAIRTGIDEAENALAGPGAKLGDEAIAAFAKARQLAGQRFQTLDRVDALHAAVEGVEPDKFVQKHVLNATVGQVRELTAILQHADPSLVGELRGQVVSHLKSRALGGVDDEFAKFSASGFRRALADIGPEKLAILFSPQDRARLAALGRTASNIQAALAGAAVNTSNTASAVMNMLMRANAIPYLNVATKPLQSAITGAKVSASLQPSVTAAAQPVPDYVRRLMQQGGAFGATTGGLFGGALGAL